MREHRTYDVKGHAAVNVAGSYDASVPVAGYYRFRLVAGGVRCGVRIWYGPPHDPVTGEELDRSWRWQAHLDGVPIDIDRVWPACAKLGPISIADYERRVKRKLWAQGHAPQSAYANPTHALDRLSTNEPLPF